MSRLHFGNIFVVRCQVFKTGREFSLEVIEVIGDFLVRPFTRLKRKNKGEKFRSEHGRDVLGWGDGKEVLAVSPVYAVRIWRRTRRVATTTR